MLAIVHAHTHTSAFLITETITAAILSVRDTPLFGMVAVFILEVLVSLIRALVWVNTALQVRCFLGKSPIISENCPLNWPPAGI